VSKYKKSCFFTQLLDIIVPAGTNSSTFNDIFLVLEKEESDLRQFMKSGANLRFGKQHLKTVLYNLLCSANFISSANVIHRDLKPANILINRSCQVKFCDFGLSRTLPEVLANR
jgi:mitogen-activated protein kinase 1/3